MQIIREEMNAIGAQEFHLPALNPAELWKESGRYEVYGETLFKITDRNQHEMVLGVTHEEEMTNIARSELRSYKQLPQMWYQIHEKYRDEPRPKSGLLRLRQFWMKDSYTFDLDEAGLDISYKKHYDAYRRIFDRCGLKYVIVEAYPGRWAAPNRTSLRRRLTRAKTHWPFRRAVTRRTWRRRKARRRRGRTCPATNRPNRFRHPGRRPLAMAEFTGESPARLMKNWFTLWKANRWSCCCGATTP